MSKVRKIKEGEEKEKTYRDGIAHAGGLYDDMVNDTEAELILLQVTGTLLRESHLF
jgi:hypothetical protein